MQPTGHLCTMHTRMIMQTQMMRTTATWRVRVVIGMLAGVLALAPLAAAQSIGMSGFAEVTTLITAQPLTLSVPTILLSNTLSIEDFSARGDARFVNGVFSLFMVRASGPLGDLSVDSTLALSPSATTLIGTVNPGGLPTMAYFEWGTTIAYGNETTLQSVGSGTNDVVLQEAVGGLTLGVTYHYRVVAINGNGTWYGLDGTFTPTAPFFSWQTTLSLDVLGLTLWDTTYLTSPQSRSYNLARFSGAADSFDFTASARFGLCEPTFFEADVCLDWRWALCDTPLTACISFDGSQGFESLRLTATGVPLFHDVLGAAAVLDIQTLFTLQQKTVLPTLRLDGNWLICPDISLLGELVLLSPGLGIGAIDIYGMNATVPVGEAIFHIADSFIDNRNASVTGKAAYFELVSLEVPLVSCCNSSGRVKSSVYFERSPGPSDGIFGIGLLEGLVEFQISQHVAVSFTSDFQLASSTWAVTTRVRVLW